MSKDVVVPFVANNAAEWKRQLVTHEDRLHLHKTLGMACLLSFAWRYAHIGSSDMGFRSHPHLTVPTLLLHLALTASSFEFQIPKKRILDGTRIWPEYRLHAMVFLCRSVAVIALYWYEEQYNLPRYHDVNFLIVLAAMAAADLCSASVGTQYRSNSVRDIDLHPVVKYFFSVMQFYATAGFLMGMRRYTFIFLSVMVVQMTPFLGTLRRKNLISAQLGAFLYGLFLVTSTVISVHFSPGGTMTQIRCTACFGFAAAFWRLFPLPHSLRLLQNKYLLWTVVALVMRHMRPHFEEYTESQVTAAFRLGLIALLGLGYYKVRYGYNNSRYAQLTATKKVA